MNTLCRRARTLSMLEFLHGGRKFSDQVSASLIFSDHSLKHECCVNACWTCSNAVVPAPRLAAAHVSV